MASCPPAAGQGGKGLPLDNPGPDRVPTAGKAPGFGSSSTSRESPGLRVVFHQPGATRHPWRDAPFCGHPDRAPAPSFPSPGPADGFELGCGRNEQRAFILVLRTANDELISNVGYCLLVINMDKAHFSH
jgi:hypothetical protein